MSSSLESLHELISKVEASVVEHLGSSSPGGSDIATATQRIQTIKKGFDSIRFRLNICSHILEVINSFEWSKIHQFETLKNETDGKIVTQKLCVENIYFMTREKSSMEWFILTYIYAFFSYLYGIVDNFASITISVFNIPIPRNTGHRVMLKKVPISDYALAFQQNLLDNDDLAQIRKIRVELEHYNLDKAFPFKPSYLGSAGDDPGAPLLTDLICPTKSGYSIDRICQDNFRACISYFSIFLERTSPLMVSMQNRSLEQSP